MSNFKITAEEFLRLAQVIEFFESNVREDEKVKINTIRLENKNGRGIAVVTNKKVASIQDLGSTDSPDGVCYLKITPQLSELAKRGAQRGLPIQISTIPEIAMATAQITGEYLNDVCHWFDENPLDNWRSWIRQAPATSSGIMSWDLFHIETLIKSSPSGQVVFPEFIDADKPLMIFDRFHAGWVGVFIPSELQLSPDIVHMIKGRHIPNWLGV